jgi:voltage-gated potassium channel
LAEDRWGFVRGHPLDVAAVALPMVRSLRLVASIARVAALSRRGLAERVIASTVLIASTMLLAGASVGLEAERPNIASFGDAMWWALTTVTTVGYGDRYPVTAEGRVVGGVLMVVGIATMGAVTAAIASQLMNTRRSAEPQPADERVRQLEAQIAHLTAQLDSAGQPHPGNG